MENEKVITLIKKYEEIRKSPAYGEKYKWDYFEEHRDVFSNLSNLHEKIKQLGSPNFTPNFWRTSAFRHLAHNRESFFRERLTDLFDETKMVRERINKFIHEINNFLKNDKDWRNREYTNPGVESASFFLVLKNAKKYLLFTRLKPYNNFAKDFNLPSNLTDTTDRGAQYAAWLEFCNSNLVQLMNKVTGSEHTLLDCQDFIYYLQDFEVSPQETKKDYIKNNLSTSINLILYGPPGTGKTFKTKEYVVDLIEHVEV